MGKLNTKLIEDALFRENDHRISDNIDKILADRTGGETILLAMDFDECAILQHLSRQITNIYKFRSPITEEDKQDTGISGITNLIQCYIGLSKEEMMQTIKDLTTSIIWRPSFLSVARFIQENGHIFPVFISSGLELGCQTALKTQKLDKFHVIADQLAFDSSDVVVGPYSVVGKKEKGWIVEKLAERGNFANIVTVGHSGGDTELIKAGSEGYRFSLRDKKSAMEVADHILDDWMGLLSYLQQKV